MINLYALTETAAFGVAIALLMFSLAKLIADKLKTPVANPLMISVIFILIFYWAFRIPVKNFDTGGDVIYMFLPPATAALAVSMYRKRELIKKNLIPILAGSVVGVAVSVGGVLILCKLFGIDKAMTASLFPKSVTTAIATELAEQIGGYAPVASAAVFITGLFGAILCPYLTKWFKINDSVATGLGIGASCHALGTAQAVKMGEIEGALGGIAIGICGLLTVVAALFM